MIKIKVLIKKLKAWKKIRKFNLLMINKKKEKQIKIEENKIKLLIYLFNF